MCNISYFKPGIMPTIQMIENVCYNNWHSYGIVTRIDGKLDIKKKVPESGEVDPKEVYDLLKKDIDYERFMHVRHNTAGATTVENCHPFDVYFNPKTGRQVVFMHNGTLYPYKSKKVGPAGNEIDDDSGPSDTKNFTDRVLIPLLSSMNCGNGLGDVSSLLVQTTLNKFWQGGNRGVLIASDQDPFFIDTWKTIGAEGQKFLSSNDEYFDKVLRGPEHTRRLVRAENERMAKENATKAAPKKVVPIVSMKDYDLDSKHPFYQLSSSLSKFVNQWDNYDREHAVLLGYATIDELKDLYSKKNDCLAIMDWVFSDYAKMSEELVELREKHEKASKMIATLVANASKKVS